MLYFPNTRWNRSLEAATAAANPVLAEGSALVASTTVGVGTVGPSGGNSGEVFVGVSCGTPYTLSSFPKTETFVQVGTTQVLARTPQASTLSVYDVTAGAAIAAGGGGWTLSGATVTLQAGTAGHTITAMYRYAPTVAEASSIQGDLFHGGNAGSLLNQTGVAKSGVVFTSEFDTSVNWFAASPVIKTGANGRFTIGGTGATVKGYVVQAPSAGGVAYGFLGIEFNAD
jgi:hypothetical protein